MPPVKTVGSVEQVKPPPPLFADSVTGEVESMVF